MRPSAEAREGGFAMIAALMGVMMFALLAYAVLAADRGATAGLDAHLQQARLEAAADAGVFTTLAGLGRTGERWPIDGGHRSLTIDAATLDIVVEDERGKVPINGLKEAQMRRLLSAGGVPAAAVNRVAASVLNWEDGTERADGAKGVDYAADDIRASAGPIKTFGELAVVKGVTQDVLDRIAPFVTVLGDAQDSFDPKTASPFALKVMSDSGEDSPDAIIRAREQAGERAKLDTGPAISYVGRPFTVRITARDDRGGAFHRSAMVELTGQPKRPYLVRALD